MGLFRNLFPPKVAANVIELLVMALDGIDDSRVSIAIPQLEAGLLRYTRTNPIREANYIGFTYNPSVASRFEDSHGRSFRVTNIRVNEKQSREASRLSVYFSRGLVCGYAFEKTLSFDPSTCWIDNSDASLEFLDTPEQEVVRLIGGDRGHLLDWSDVFEVDLIGKEYFHLKDLEDGDFIAMDKQGAFYEVTNDPFEIKPIRASNIEDILRSNRSF